MILINNNNMNLEERTKQLQEVEEIRAELIRDKIAWDAVYKENYLEIERLETKLKQIENDNLIIQGLKIEGELMEGVVEFIWKELGVQITPYRIYYNGKEDSNEIKEILMKLDGNQKMKILETKLKLKEGFVSILEDYTKEEKDCIIEIKQKIQNERGKIMGNLIEFKGLNVNLIS